MIVAAAFLPHPLLLLPEYASLADPGAELRARCRSAVAEALAAAPDSIVAITGVPRDVSTIDSRSPLGMRVAQELLAAEAADDAVSGPPGEPEATGKAGASAEQGARLEVITVPFDADEGEVAEAGARLRARAQDARTVVLVMGDGSARRSEKAPGHLDERAFAMDQVIADALAAGDPGGLSGLDAGLAEQLMIAGRAAWQALAAGLVGPPDRARAEVSDPFGVLYHVAVWEWDQQEQDLG